MVDILSVKDSEDKFSMVITYADDMSSSVSDPVTKTHF